MTGGLKVLDLETLHLAVGAHFEASNEMCIMEAVAFIAGEPWSDSPQCASPVIAAFLRSYNDSLPDAERQELRQYIPRLIGTRGTAAQEERRALIAADWIVRIHTPAWLALAGLTPQANALASLPEITSFSQIPAIKPTIEVARRDAAAAGAAARDAAWAEAWAAARDASWAEAWAASWAEASDASRAAAGDASRAAAGAAAWAASRAASGAAAGAAAGAALKPTQAAIRATVPTLIERMFSVGDNT